MKTAVQALYRTGNDLPKAGVIFNFKNSMGASLKGFSLEIGILPPFKPTCPHTIFYG